MGRLADWGDAVSTRDRIMRFVEGYILDNYYPPSIREICEALGGMSTSTVNYQLLRLEMDGKIRPRVWGRTRCIVPVGMRVRFEGE